MDKLLLNSLMIQQFRGFKDLQIQQLGRVNLIVGKNNVGKSSLLDALQIYVYRGFPTILWQMLDAHDEGVRSRRNNKIYDRDDEDPLLAVKYLFYGREDIKSTSKAIHIGPIASPNETLSLSIEFFYSKADEEGKISLQPALFEELDVAEGPIPRFSVKYGQKNRSSTYPITSSYPRILRGESGEVNCVSINSNGLGKTKIGTLWDQIALTDHEREVLNALKIIAPGVEAISIVGDPQSVRARYTIVKVAGIREPLPIRSLGDGMQRVLGIALALVNAENGILLIDEVENGLHYSAHADIWKLIFHIAHKLNIQVFATTHSWDSVVAFQQASQQNCDEGFSDDAFLVRLENRNGDIGATIFDEQQLQIATREQIEVR
ncbi:ATP-binding protein [Ktedonobacteria bacterium brp13]|nr:ATP-binding protein [Ktedonobacteria bacterium brp13]